MLRTKQSKIHVLMELIFSWEESYKKCKEGKEGRRRRKREDGEERKITLVVEINDGWRSIQNSKSGLLGFRAHDFCLPKRLWVGRERVSLRKMHKA